MLEESITEKFGGRKVNLVGHSMVCCRSIPFRQFLTDFREVLIAGIYFLNFGQKVSNPSPLRLSLPLIAARPLPTT
jgi:hypothetical protein